MPQTTVMHAASAFMAIAALAACGINVRPENYEKTTAGMNEQRVGKIFDMPGESRNATIKVGETFTSTQGQSTNFRGTIVVGFANGEAQWKRYYLPDAKPQSDIPVR